MAHHTTHVNFIQITKYNFEQLTVQQSTIFVSTFLQSKIFFIYSFWSISILLLKIQQRHHKTMTGNCTWELLHKTQYYISIINYYNTTIKWVNTIYLMSIFWVFLFVKLFWFRVITKIFLYEYTACEKYIKILLFNLPTAFLNFIFIRLFMS